jgi:hypothetical protein
MGQTEEGGAFVRVVAELMAQDAKGTGGVAKTVGDIGGRLLVDEEGAEGFVLPLEGEQRRKEEFLIRLSR